MLRKLWEKCVNYETVSYIICGFLTTAVDFAVYALLRQIEIGVGLSQAMSWLAAVLFAYVVNKLIVFRNYNLRPSYLVKEVGGICGCTGVLRSRYLGAHGGHGEIRRRQGNAV